MPLAEKGVRGKGAAALVPAQGCRDRERDQGSESQLTGFVKITPSARICSSRLHRKRHFR